MGATRRKGSARAKSERWDKIKLTDLNPHVKSQKKIPKKDEEGEKKRARRREETVRLRQREAVRDLSNALCNGDKGGGSWKKRENLA